MDCGAEARRWWPTLAEVALGVREELARCDESMALRVLVDGVARVGENAHRDAGGDTLAQPPTTGDPRWDALLAGVLRYVLHRRGMTAPRWTLKDPLPAFWSPIRTDASKELNDLAHSPAELLRLGIFMDERGLASA